MHFTTFGTQQEEYNVMPNSEIFWDLDVLGFMNKFMYSLQIFFIYFYFITTWLLKIHFGDPEYKILC